MSESEPEFVYTQGLGDRYWYYSRIEIDAPTMEQWIGPFMTKTCAIQHSKDGTFRVID
jgi:hypothetical protein